MIIVAREDLDKIAHELRSKHISLDTETTGLELYKQSRVFSVILADENEEYYFNLNPEDPTSLPPRHAVDAIAYILQSEKYLFMHNAKFDLAGLITSFGITTNRICVDTMTLDRLYKNDELSYSLESVAKRHGLEKSSQVEEYIKKNKLYDKNKNKLFHKVPLEVMAPYACKDARITFALAGILMRKLATLPIRTSQPSPFIVAQQEERLVKCLLEMEVTGVQLDQNFLSEAIFYYEEILQDKEKEFEALTGKPYSKGKNTFSEVFKDEKISFTEKNNPKFDAKTMKKFKHPAAKVSIEIAEAKKQLDYFTNFSSLVDDKGVIHANFMPAGTATGRFSSRNPNLQNLTNPDKYESSANTFPVRKVFVPRAGFFFAMIDYSQIEYRVMLDLAGAEGLIKKIKTGLDVHEATAQVAGISRKQAKTVNFLTLYGGGKQKLADALETTILEATKIQDSIFSAAPEVKTFIYSTNSLAKNMGMIHNHFGRYYTFTDRNFSYKATNYKVQGTCADILKKAMVDCAYFLQHKKSRMLLTIHDELIFEVAYDEAEIVPQLGQIMELAYEHKSLPLVVDIEWSDKNMAEKYAWSEFYEKTRNRV